jgi:hypothetical protein
MIRVLSERAVCMCPHGGRLQFIVTHRSADGADGQMLTMPDYSRAMVVGCVLPPIAGGPCMKVAFAQDPIGQAIKVRGQQVVTQTVISITDKGWPIIVATPGMSGASIMYTPSLRTFRRAEFGRRSVEMKRVGGMGGMAGATAVPPGGAGSGSPTPRKDVLAAHWGAPYARRREALPLVGYTTGFGDGTSATLLVYRFDPDGSHQFTTRLSGTVQRDRIETEWTFDYPDDVTELPDIVEGDESYDAPEYFFELKVGGKTARSGLVEFVDSIEIELPEEDKEDFADLDYVVHFADGTSRRGRLEDGRVKLEDIPPGKVHWEFLPREKRIELVTWGQSIVHRGEQVALRAETAGFDDGTVATLQIFAYRDDGDHELVGHLAAAVERDRVEAVWPFEYHGEVADLPDPVGREDDVYAPIRYFFDVEVDGHTARSGMLEFRDWIEFEVVSVDEQPLAYQWFVARFADGSQREFRLDRQGHARLDAIPPGKVYLDRSARKKSERLRQSQD